MTRSSSTYMTKVLLHGPCYVNLNEILYQDPKHSGEAWTKDGKDVSLQNGTQLARFIDRVGHRRCLEMWLANGIDKHSRLCRNNCVAAYKHFSVHVKNRKIHEDIWKSLPNMTAVVIERNVEARWRSHIFARLTGDWNHYGADDHRLHLDSFTAPRMKPEFAKEHKKWYQFVREKLLRRVEVTFEESTKNASSVLERIDRAMPKDFRGLLLLTGR
eukprot:TRINITY_DN96932_c0_g1_i1.p1 TRINITY_DN96932_c0_g1~~TRINITY_DN96932_c0_g1_i1.p1  ORF type:complete len:215 (+),score=17.71 TRINITY_DN96932_c0_g1_i1:3-647(+)